MTERYRKIKKIGSGSFAKVYLAENLTDQRKVALKVINKKSLTCEKVRERLYREIDNMEVLQHEGIVEYYESFETKSDVYIAMEYLPGGELFDYISDKCGLTEKKARKMFSQLVSTISYCHKNGVAHRDLKLENILLTSDEKLKIVDFGFSKDIHPENMLATCCGSALYASPEMVLGKPYKGPECDVWSLGVILFCMLTASMPFDDSDWNDFIFSVQRGAYLQPNVSESAQHLISRMLDPYAKTRATIEEVLSHPWMNPLPRKSSLQLPPAMNKSRRNGISHSHSSSLQIRAKLIQECTEECVCECHHKTLKISEQVSHCQDCQPIVELLSTSRGTYTSSLSVSSSGYSSMESLAHFNYFPQSATIPEFVLDEECVFS